MNGPQDQPPGAAPVQARRNQPALSDEARARLGTPPGHEAELERLKALREASELDRLQKELDEVEEYRMPLMEHLIELRDRLIKAAIALVIGMAVGVNFGAELFDFLKKPFVEAMANAEGVSGGLSLTTSPFEGMAVYMKVGLIAGFILASPVISWQIWGFVAPGLYKTERKMVAPLAASSVFLFLSGAAFCYYFIFPYAFPFFINVLKVDVNLSVDGYLTAIVHMMLAFGMCFQLPIGSFFAARMGFVDHIDLAKGFRYAVVAIFIVAAIITPPDVVTQTMIGIPMVLLYILGIGVAYMFTTKVRTVEGAEVEADGAFPVGKD